MLTDKHPKLTLADFQTNIFFVISAPALRTSPQMLSTLAALPFFNLLKVYFTSSVIVPVSICSIGSMVLASLPRLQHTGSLRVTPPQSVDCSLPEAIDIGIVG
jgi:hypothetical protein